MSSPLSRPAYRTIYGIGRNYSDHAKELGNPTPQSLVVFLKPMSAIVEPGEDVFLPAHSSNVHHEGELVLLIGRKGKAIAEQDAISWIHSVAIGMDLTARDLQDQAKKAGLPWAIAKGFDTSAVLGNWVPFEQISDPSRLGLTLDVNGQRRQSGSVSQMIFPLAQLISELSQLFTLHPGDVVFTGTPAGVGPLQEGDVILAQLWEDGPGLGRVLSRSHVGCRKE